MPRQLAVDILRPHAVGESIWGVDEDEAEFPPCSAARRNLAEPAPDVGADQLGPLARGRAAATLPSAGRVSRSTRTAARGAARERLDRQRAGAAVEVEDAGALDPLAERREDRLADAVGGRPHLPAARRDQASAPSALRRSRLSLDRRTTRSQGIGSAAPAPKRRRAASSSGPSAGSSSEPWRRSSASTSLASLEQQRRVVGQLGDGEARQAAAGGCRGSPPRRAAPRSTSASLKPSRSRGDRLQPLPRQLARLFGEQQALRAGARRGRPGRAAGAAGRRRSARPPRSP